MQAPDSLDERVVEAVPLLLARFEPLDLVEDGVGELLDAGDDVRLRGPPEELFALLEGLKEYEPVAVVGGKERGTEFGRVIEGLPDDTGGVGVHISPRLIALGPLGFDDEDRAIGCIEQYEVRTPLNPVPVLRHDRLVPAVSALGIRLDGVLQVPIEFEVDPCLAHWPICFMSR